MFESLSGRLQRVMKNLSGQGRVSESVLKADMGVVDVYWAEKLEVADQKSKVQQEKAALMSDLEARFNLIRQKLNQ